jgi:hypothetical protein
LISFKEDSLGSFTDGSVAYFQQLMYSWDDNEKDHNEDEDNEDDLEETNIKFRIFGICTSHNSIYDYILIEDISNLHQTKQSIIMRRLLYQPSWKHLLNRILSDDENLRLQTTDLLGDMLYYQKTQPDYLEAIKGMIQTLKMYEFHSLSTQNRIKVLQLQNYIYATAFV